MKTEAVIIAKQTKQLTLSVAPQASCSHCRANKQCITGLLSQQKENKAVLDVENENEWHIGQNVELLIGAYSLLKGAMWLYLFPLGMLFAFSLIAQFFFNQPAITIVFAILGISAGIAVARWRLRYCNWQQQLKIQPLNDINQNPTV